MNIVKELRKKKGIQQKELAIILGVAQPTISDWENQKKDPSGNRLKKLAEYFGIDELIILGKNVVDLTKKEPTQDEQADGDITAMIEQFQRLSQAEKQQVLAFVAGILSTHAP